jgi:hypothetical protein
MKTRSTRPNRGERTALRSFRSYQEEDSICDFEAGWVCRRARLEVLAKRTVTALAGNGTQESFILSLVIMLYRL